MITGSIFGLKVNRLPNSNFMIIICQRRGAAKNAVDDAGDNALGHLHLLAQLGGGSGGGRLGSVSIGGAGDGLGGHDDGGTVRDPIGGDGVLAGVGGERRLALGIG